MRTRISACINCLENESSQASQAQGQLSELEEKISGAVQRRQAAFSARGALQEQLNFVTSTQEAIEDEITKLNEELRIEEELHLECASTRDALLSRLQVVRLKAEETNELAQKTEADIRDQQRHCEGLSQHLTELTQELLHITKEGERLGAREQEVEEALSAASVESESMVSSLKDMQYQIEQHKLKQQTLQAKMDASLKEIEQGSAALQSLERETDRAQAALDAMRMARRSAEQTKERTEKELQEEEKLKLSAESTVVKMNADITAMRRAYDSRQADILRLQEELEREKKLLEGGEDKWREGDVARREVAVQRAMLDQAATRARAELESMQSSYQKTKGELDAALEEIRKLTAESRKAEQEIQVVISEKNVVSLLAPFLLSVLTWNLYDLVRSKPTSQLWQSNERQSKLNFKRCATNIKQSLTHMNPLYQRFHRHASLSTQPMRDAWWLLLILPKQAVR